MKHPATWTAGSPKKWRFGIWKQHQPPLKMKGFSKKVTQKSHQFPHIFFWVKPPFSNIQDLPGTWRIIPVSKWLITMVSKSPNWAYSPSKWLKMAYKWWLLTTYSPPSSITNHRCPCSSVLPFSLRRGLSFFTALDGRGLGRSQLGWMSRKGFVRINGLFHLF